MLQCQPAPGRPHERTANRNDWTVTPRHTGVVSEQKMQRQEEINDAQASTTAAREGG